MLENTCFTTTFTKLLIVKPAELTIVTRNLYVPAAFSMALVFFGGIAAIN